MKKSRYEIKQFCEVKKCLINFSFKFQDHKQLSVEIIDNVMDELRRERKIKMVLEDADIEEYIRTDLAIAETQKEEERSLFTNEVLKDKKKFRGDMC